MIILIVIIGLIGIFIDGVLWVCFHTNRQLVNLQVKHDTTTYKIEIWKEYNCLECMDRRWVWGGKDDEFQIVCPFCQISTNRQHVR